MPYLFHIQVPEIDHYIYGNGSVRFNFSCFFFLFVCPVVAFIWTYFNNTRYVRSRYIHSPIFWDSHNQCFYILWSINFKEEIVRDLWVKNSHSTCQPSFSSLPQKHSEPQISSLSIWWKCFVRIVDFKYNFVMNVDVVVIVVVATIAAAAATVVVSLLFFFF